MVGFKGRRVEVRNQFIATLDGIADHRSDSREHPRLNHVAHKVVGRRRFIAIYSKAR